MLINAVQGMETPKRVIPSLVWLGSVDSVYSILPHALYLSRLSGFVLRGGIEDREVDMKERPRLPRAY